MFQKLFRLFRKRYEGLGRIGGSVNLSKFSEAELQELSGFTGIPLQVLQKKQSITLLQFERSLKGTRFRDHSLLQLLKAFYGEALLDRKQQKSLQDVKDQHFIQQMRQQFSSIEWYIDWLEERSVSTNWVWRIADRDERKMIDLLAFLQETFHFLQVQEGSMSRLPIVAQAITGDPHGLDRSHLRGRLLLHALRVHQQFLGNETRYSSSSEDENELLSLYGVLKDDLWSFVTCQNLLAKVKGNDHPVWRAASDSETILNIPLKEILKIDCVIPKSGSTVWILENSSVASTVMGLNPSLPIICTHGQLRLAGWKLLDYLVAEGTHIHYSGDLDPEGILIADKVKRKYGEAVSFWCMDAFTYLEGIEHKDGFLDISNEKKENSSDSLEEPVFSMQNLAENRLTKLKSVTSRELKELAGEMIDKKVAVYQESFIQKLIKIGEQFSD